MTLKNSLLPTLLDSTKIIFKDTFNNTYIDTYKDNSCIPEDCAINRVNLDKQCLWWLKRHQL